jgi:hypothetical protein
VSVLYRVVVSVFRVGLWKREKITFSRHTWSIIP